MDGIKIFDGMPDEELNNMLNCFKAKRRKFSSGSNVTQKTGEKQLGVILSGKADLIRFDYDGYRNIMEHLTQGDVFGEAGAAHNDELAVICDGKCEILFIDHAKIVKPCQNACPCHSALISNLLRSTEQKLQKQRNHLDILSRRTLRNKLIAYFKVCANSSGGNTFTLPFGLADLANYLFVDRSAMLREMKKLRDDGIITSQGRKITIKNTFSAQ